ncbi:MAG: hypothetical protein NZ840_09465 [Anaerolineales bacterium]|nr:hypothetical protein [Anaerolineales bacterium]MDW8162269.1 hypothetical protein [Anaerolineales bacterium]
MLKRYLQNETFYTAVAVLFLMLIAYGIWIPFLGLYREDWYTVWNGVVRGPSGFIPMYAGERPLMGYLYAFLYPILGNPPWSWGLYAFLLRFLSALVFYALLRRVWGERPQFTFLATLFFAIYPGFLQQVQPNCFQMHFHGILLALLSMYWLICSLQVTVQWHGWVYRLLAIASAALYPFTMEYYIGLEGTRLALLWVLFRQKTPSKSLRKFLLEWLPFLLITALFLYWRVFVFQSTRPTLNTERLFSTYGATLQHGLLRLGVELGRDFIETAFLAWAVPLYNQWYYGPYRTQLIGFLLALLGAAGGGLLLKQHRRWIAHQEGLPFPPDKVREICGVGAVSALSALLPVVATLQEIRFVARDDRYSLPASIGAAILLACLLTQGMRGKLRFWAVLALIFSALLTHAQYARYMIDFWQVQRQIWWQLSWRAPNLEPDTLLMVNLPEPFYFIEGYEIWASANMIYYPREGRPPLGGELIDQDSVGELAWREKSRRVYRGIPLTRNFEFPLVLSMPTLNSCLYVLDGTRLEVSSREEPLVRLAARYSQTQRILIDQDFRRLDERVFGEEPPHTWCYYYQKASYHRQKGEWQAILRLAEEVAERELAPKDVYEWLPFFVAYAMTGRTKEADDLARKIRSDRSLRASLCREWLSSPSGISKEDPRVLHDYLCSKRAED